MVTLENKLLWASDTYDLLREVRSAPVCWSEADYGELTRVTVRTAAKDALSRELVACIGSIYISDREKPPV